MTSLIAMILNLILWMGLFKLGHRDKKFGTKVNLQTSCNNNKMYVNKMFHIETCINNKMYANKMFHIETYNNYISCHKETSCL